MTFAETDLYEPVCRFLEEEGYRVQAEVKDCDIAAEKDGELIIVELKKSFQLKLVYQALDRQSLTEQVFVAIPRPQKGQREKSWKNMLKLLKRLEIGLLTVALDSPLKTVDVVLTPSDSLAWKNTAASGTGKQTGFCQYGRHEPQENRDGLSGKSTASVLYSGKSGSRYIWRTAGNGAGRKVHVHTPQQCIPLV